MENDITTMLAQGAKLRVRTYADGAGVPGSEVLTVDSGTRVIYSYDGPSTLWEVVKGFILGVVCGGIFVVPVIVFVGLFVSCLFFGVKLESGTWVPTLLYAWAILTFVAGLLTAWWSAEAV